MLVPVSVAAWRRRGNYAPTSPPELTRYSLIPTEFNMTLLDYGLPLASFAGAGLAWWFMGKAKEHSEDCNVSLTACEWFERRADERADRALVHARKAAKCAAACQAVAATLPANTDVVDDKFVGILNDAEADVFCPVPDSTAEHKPLKVGDVIKGEDIWHFRGFVKPEDIFKPNFGQPVENNSITEAK